MTLLQEIQNLTWWNEPNKLKSILTKLNTLVSNLTTRVATLEENTGGDFIPLSGTTVGNPVTGDIEFSIPNDETTRAIYAETALVSIQLAFTESSVGMVVGGDYTTGVGVSERDINISSTDTTSKGIYSDSDFSANLTALSYPQKIYVDSNIPKPLTEYADNTSAIAGGLIVGQQYRTGDLVKVVH